MSIKGQFTHHNRMRENPNRKLMNLREANNHKVLGYEYHYKGQWYDIAIMYKNKLVFLDLVPRYKGSGIPKRDKRVTIKKIRQCKKDNIQLILVEPDTVSKMKGQIETALLTGESGVIKLTKMELAHRNK